MMTINVQSLLCALVITTYGSHLVNSYGIPIESEGLYNETDDVLTYTSKNFVQNVYDKPYSTLAEFYNSFCGYCRNFAPVYKELATDLLRWSSIVKIVALDCTAEENGRFCAEYDVNIYPTIRYYSAGLKYYDGTDDKNLRNRTLGHPIVKSTLDVLRSDIVYNLRNETSAPSGWPDLHPLQITDRKKIFNDLPDQVKYLFLIYGPDKDLTGNLVQLDLYNVTDVAVRYVTEPGVAKVLNLFEDNEEYSLAYINRDLQQKTFKLTNFTRNVIRERIFGVLKELKIQIPDWIEQNKLETMDFVPPSTSEEDRKKLVDFVHKSPYSVYMSDIEAAIRFAIFNEIPRNGEITGDRLVALKDFIKVLSNYAGVDASVKTFLDSLHNHVVMINEKVTGFQFNKFVRLAETNTTIFPRNRLIGCVGSTSALRGYTCGLWQLFHHLTVEAALHPKSTDGNEVLKAIHGYISSFFGCTTCSQHFQNISAELNIFDMKDHAEAVVWLWKAHNRVNDRLSGDLTDDPEFPKKQFPTAELCMDCQMGEEDGKISWYYPGVRDFLFRIYKAENLNAITIEELDTAINNNHSKRYRKSIVMAFHASKGAT